MTDAAINKTDLLRKLCGILAGWLVFLTAFYLVAFLLLTLFDLLNLEYHLINTEFSYSFYLTIAEIVIVTVLSFSTGLYAALRISKYLTKLLKTKSNQTIILVLIALLFFVMITFHWLYIFREI